MPFGLTVYAYVNYIREGFNKDPVAAPYSYDSAALATTTLGDLRQSYDGAPKGVTATTVPSGLAVTLTYGGNVEQPWTPGAHAVEATIDNPNYEGAAIDTLLIEPTASVRRAPTLSGGLSGSVQMLTGENLTLAGNTWISGDLLVPGTPTVQVNVPTYVSTIDANGQGTPAGYTVTLNPHAVVRHVVRRIDPVAIESVAPPPAPAGTRNVVLTSPAQNPGDFATLRNLTMAGAAGTVALPPGTYGNIILNGGGTLVLGIAGATEPAVYNFQLLTVNPLLVGSGQIQVVGPVQVTVAGNASLFGSSGNAAHPEWLVLRSSGGGISTNGTAQVYGELVAPAGSVSLLGGSRVTGRVRADRLTIAANALLEEQEP